MLVRSSLYLIGTLFLSTSCTVVLSFTSPFTTTSSSFGTQRSNQYDSVLEMMTEQNEATTTTSTSTTTSLSRRILFRSTIASATSAFLISTTQSANAADENNTNQPQPTAQTPLYFILRVKEATEQETRLIKSGQFKDVQRANVKLAVKFMLDNYRLNDNFIAASAFLVGDRKIKAVDIGQNTVQNLQTILEYFDSSDVENIKISSSGLSGKETIVLNGLAAARKGIDDFVSLFPKDDVSAVIAKIEAENELNRQEFDSGLGSILNPKPVAAQS